MLDSTLIIWLCFARQLIFHSIVMSSLPDSACRLSRIFACQTQSLLYFHGPDRPLCVYVEGGNVPLWPRAVEGVRLLCLYAIFLSEAKLRKNKHVPSTSWIGGSWHSVVPLNVYKYLTGRCGWLDFTELFPLCAH